MLAHVLEYILCVRLKSKAVVFKADKNATNGSAILGQLCLITALGIDASNQIVAVHVRHKHVVYLL